MNFVIAAILGLTLPTGIASSGKSFEFTGEYVEGCSCMGICPCELTGVAMGCEGVGAFHASKASYNGMDISGFKAAYALEPGKWVVLYIDAPDGKFDTASAFMKGALAAFGPVEAVKKAKIDISGNGGAFTATVDGGNTMTLTTVPILGGDSKTPLVYNNIHDALHPTIMQGKTIDCAYKDGDHSFSLKGSNAYFNDHIRSHGEF